MVDKSKKSEDTKPRKRIKRPTGARKTSLHNAGVRSAKESAALADIEASKPESEAPSLQATLPAEIEALVSFYDDWTYNSSSPQYPEDMVLPKFVDHREPHEHTHADCTTFVGSVVMAYTLTSYTWYWSDYKDLMVMGDDIWSAPAVWARATGNDTNAIYSESFYSPGSVFAVQGWNEARTRGHQWLEMDGLCWHMSRTKGRLVRAATGLSDHFHDTRRVVLISG